MGGVTRFFVYATIGAGVLSVRIREPVMPAQAGIQDLQAEASRYASWIPGLALLARNDVSCFLCGKTYLLYTCISKTQLSLCIGKLLFISLDN